MRRAETRGERLLEGRHPRAERQLAGAQDLRDGVLLRVAEGNGPVHALDAALRAAIGERYPHLRDIKLVNYKVRILDEWKATGAVTRVLLDASDGQDTWGAIGVHENVIEASWDALVDSLEAGMLPGRVSHHRRAAATPAP